MVMAIECGPKHSLDVLTHQRTALLQLRRRRPNKPARDGESELAQRLLADALVVRAEAGLR